MDNYGQPTGGDYLNQREGYDFPTFISPVCSVLQVFSCIAASCDVNTRVWRICETRINRNLPKDSL